MTAPALRVLLTEDVGADAELEVRELKRAGLRITSLVVDSEEAFTRGLREFAPDVILSDFSMPGFDGMAALALARQVSPDTPFVFVSGTIGEEYAIRALKSGATDYVLKTNLVRLPAAVERAVLEAKERRDRRSMEAELGVARERLASIISSLPDMLWSVEMPGENILYVSPTSKEIFGRDPEDFVSDPDLWIEVVHPEDRPAMLEAWRQMAAEGRAFDIEYRILRRDGALRWVNDRGHVVSGADGAPVRVDGVVRDITEQVGHRQRISYLAHYDTLTGLPNRTLFHERLTQAAEAARRGGASFAVALLDFERFKAINDTLGQNGGDKALEETAQRLREAAGGDINSVARLGGNLFAIVLHGDRDMEGVARRLEQKVALLAAPLLINGREVRLASKSGVAIFPQDGSDADTLFRNAEASLRRAKDTGERYLFYAPHINARLAEQVELEHCLRKAVEQGELFLHYQPKVELATRRIVGLEALMRWIGPDGVAVSPMKFVPVLEQTGLILEAGRQAFATASAAYRSWQGCGHVVPRIAVNVSALQLRRASFVSDVRGALHEAGGDGGGVDLEITESLLMTEVDETIRKLWELRGMGLRVALDDFGTGYSSLAYLSKLPVDNLKIDRAFIHAMTENVDDTSIISTIITLAQSLRLNVVAEGVETEQQAQLLRLLRCDQAQGYLFSPPVPAERIPALLASDSAKDSRL